MQAITQAALAALLSSVKGATFATLTTETDARLKKTGNPFGEVRKVSRVNVCLGFQYEAAVNRQRTREGSEADFEVAPRQWGERIAGTMFIEHKGNTYLETKVERSLDHTYLDSMGNELTDAEVAPWLPARSWSGRQETEKEIMVRTYALDSIRGIAFGGETYVLLETVAAPMLQRMTRIVQEPVTV